jgi:hypothetical protein
MCQKAFGSYFAPLAGVPPEDFAWVKGTPGVFRSSAAAERGFCRDCGTPLFFRYVDKDRIGIIGGSYGGYMVLAALAYKPEEFAVGVDIFGVANWVRTLESIPPYWESFRLALYKEIGNPESQHDFLLATSPLNHAANIDVPLMVLQGANDPRVIQPESDDIVAAVKANGVEVEYIVFPDEGHGFTKKANQISGYGAMLTFLDKYLRDAPVPAPPARPARIPPAADGTTNDSIPVVAADAPAP